MARVLFFLQWIVALIVLPLWPGLEPRYILLGLVFLGVVLALPFAAVVAVFGFPVTREALADAWSATPLGPRSRSSAAVWDLAVRIFPLGGMLGGILALVGALQNFNPLRPLLPQVLILGIFTLVWGLLGLLLATILHHVVIRLSAVLPRPLLVLTEGFSQRFGLTSRESEATQAVLDGLTYKDAAEKLSISPATIKSHVLKVYQKTGAGNKIELLRLVEAENTRIHQSVDGRSRGSDRL